MLFILKGFNNRYPYLAWTRSNQKYGKIAFIWGGYLKFTERQLSHDFLLPTAVKAKLCFTICRTGFVEKFFADPGNEQPKQFWPPRTYPGLLGRRLQSRRLGQLPKCLSCRQNWRYSHSEGIGERTGRAQRYFARKLSGMYVCTYVRVVWGHSLCFYFW